MVERIPPPPNNIDKPLRALIFDSYYDSYKVSTPVMCSNKITFCEGNAWFVRIIMERYCCWLLWSLGALLCH